MARASVDLPEPDSPTTATVRPRGTLDGDVLENLDAAAIGRVDIVDPQHRLVARRGRGVASLRTAQSDLGIVLLRRLQHLAGGRFLDQLAVAQHHDAVGHLGHHREIVGDVDRRGVELVDDVADGGQHLDLGGDVERGGRLVEDDEVGPAGHGHGGHGALQLAARDLVGIALADRVGIGQLQPAVEIDGVLLRPCRADR